ncbi:MAG: GNAT family N-acetyltransferase [Deltaproteobacteria bacterium]|nr:GNAT family N-acetyltransferase [Deltaproteobacteria bacterium]
MFSGMQDLTTQSFAPDDRAWQDAGGEPEPLVIARATAQAAPLIGPRGRVLATLHADHHPTGALYDLHGGPETLALGESWLRERGCLAAQGPLLLCPDLGFGANLGPFEEPPFSGEPQADPAPWLAAGYRVVARYSSHLMSNEAARRYGEAKGPRELKIRTLDSLEDALARVMTLTEPCYHDAYAHLHLPPGVRQAGLARLKGLFDPRLILFATVNGEDAGFLFAHKDGAAPERHRFIIRGLGVRPAWRKSGVGARLVAAAHAAAEGLGLTHGVHACMWSNSRSLAISSKGGEPFREYALFMKAI